MGPACPWDAARKDAEDESEKAVADPGSVELGQGQAYGVMRHSISSSQLSSSRRWRSARILLEDVSSLNGLGSW